MIFNVCIFYWYLFARGLKRCELLGGPRSAEATLWCTSVFRFIEIEIVVGCILLGFDDIMCGLFLYWVGWQEKR